MSGPLAPGSGRVRRQATVVVGLLVAFGGLAVLVASPDLTPVLQRDLPSLAVGLVGLFVGGLLLGLGRARPGARHP